MSWPCKIPSKLHLIKLVRALLDLPFARDDLPPITFFDHHRHLELPRMDLGYIELDDNDGPRVH